MLQPTLLDATVGVEPPPYRTTTARQQVPLPRAGRCGRSPRDERPGDSHPRGGAVPARRPLDVRGAHRAAGVAERQASRDDAGATRRAMTEAPTARPLCHRAHGAVARDGAGSCRDAACASTHATTPLWPFCQPAARQQSPRPRRGVVATAVAHPEDGRRRRRLCPVSRLTPPAPARAGARPAGSAWWSPASPAR